MRDASFPAGRNPWRNFYGGDDLEKLTKILKLARQDAPRLQRKLRLTASKYVLEQSESLEAGGQLSALTYRSRCKFLRKQVVEPAQVLLSALAHNNQVYFSLFPNLEHTDLPRYPALSRLPDDLMALKNWADALATSIDDLSRTTGEERPASMPLTDFKYALVWDLLQIYIDLPPGSSKASRVPTIVNERNDDRKQRARGEFVDFVRAAAQPILNRKEELTAEMRAAIRKFRSMKNADV